MTERNSIHFPPEWAEQSAVLIAWPYGEGDFNPWLADVEATYGLIAQAISHRQKLIIAVRDAAHRQHVLAALSEHGAELKAITLAAVPYNDVWVRDTAPLTVQTVNGPQLLDFQFNGWGNKYEHGDDARLACRLHESGVFGATPMAAVEFVLEGGSLETDGAGTLLTTARCLLNPNRNPRYERAEIEEKLKSAFGLNRVLWLQHGYAEGDDTDAHVDTLARFCSPDTLAYTACDDATDPLFNELKAMAEELRGLSTPAGQPYRLVPLPIPRPIYSEDGDRLPATYANFLIINGAVLVPTYDDPADEVALARLADCFPDREIIAIHCTPLIRQYGSIHCMTMQFPSTVTVK